MAPTRLWTASQAPPGSWPGLRRREAPASHKPTLGSANNVVTAPQDAVQSFKPAIEMCAQRLSSSRGPHLLEVASTGIRRKQVPKKGGFADAALANDQDFDVLRADPRWDLRAAQQHSVKAFRACTRMQYAFKSQFCPEAAECLRG